MGNKLFGIAAMIILLAGCGLREDYKEAAENYIQSNCDTVVNVEMWFAAFNGAIEGPVQYDCAEEGGVKRYRFKVSDVPGKYWKKEE